VDLKSTNVSELVVPDTVKYMNINKDGIRYINYPDGVIVENEKEGYTNLEGLYLCSDFFSTTVLDKCADPVVMYNNETYNKTNFADLDKQLKSYRVENGALISCYNTVSEFEIPSDVTSISDNAFYGCTELEKVTILDSVTVIGEKAFSGCTGLTEIVIPDSVTTLSSSAFADCSSLTSVTIGNGVTKSGVSVFKNCKNVKYLSYNSGNFVSSFPDLETVIIGDDIDEIGVSEFEGYRNLSSVTIGSGVIKIDASAFEGCIALTDITIPDGVVSVGESAFKGCQALTSVVIPESVTELNATAFEGCKNVKSLTYGTEILSREIVDCFPELDTVVVDSGIQTIEGGLFANLPLLKNVTISEGVLIIGASAFENCTQIESIVIPDSVTDIGSSAFWGDTALTDLTIGKGVLNIHSNAFLSCKGFKKLSCNNNLIHKVISDYPYENLETIIIGDYVTEIDLNVADGGKEIIVDENNTVFSSVDGVLYSKDKKTLILCPDKKEGSYTIADGTVTIDKSAFADCKSL
ncbi:MAG: leucine-rich repeat domain-containing protein, partial [Ruminococcus sp.]|nr:leucine-rich repeat domain-containing protein [Ruminococcus sp.]